MFLGFITSLLWLFSASFAYDCVDFNKEWIVTTFLIIFMLGTIVLGRSIGIQLDIIKIN